jgi:hypothetical protein
LEAHVTSETTALFWKAYYALPEDVQWQAREAYRFFRSNPQHPGLQFKQVVPAISLCSVRVTRGYRALGTLQSDKITWFWIGGHVEYDRLIQSLR